MLNAEQITTRNLVNQCKGHLLKRAFIRRNTVRQLNLANGQRQTPHRTRPPRNHETETKAYPTTRPHHPIPTRPQPSPIRSRPLTTSRYAPSTVQAPAGAASDTPPAITCQTPTGTRPATKNYSHPPRCPEPLQPNPLQHRTSTLHNHHPFTTPAAAATRTRADESSNKRSSRDFNSPV